MNLHELEHLISISLGVYLGLEMLGQLATLLNSLKSHQMDIGIFQLLLC